MEAVGDRVKKERKKLQWSQTVLANKLGVTQAAISEIERNVTKSSSLIIDIAELFKMNAGELLYGKANPDTVDEYLITSNVVLIPRYPIEHISIDNNNIGTADDMPFSREFLSSHKLPESRYLGVIKAIGTAMSPTIEDGQTLILNTLNNIPKNGKLYLISINGTIFLKRFLYTPKGWLLRSDNPDKNAYPDFDVSIDEINEIDIQGRIVWRGGIL